MNEIVTTEQRPLAPTSAPAEGSMLNFIAQAVADPNVDVTKLQALLTMQREVEADDARRQFTAALHAAQQEMPRVSKRGRIKLVKDGVSKGELPFATWEDVDTAIRPIMKQHGFSLSFSAGMRPDGTGAIVTARLLHTAGHAQEASIPLPPDVGAGRNALQAMGSTLSYAKRYLAEMLFNIVRENEDDDGQAGGTRRIGDDQKEQLVEMMMKCREAGDAVNEPKFFGLFGIATLDEMAARDFTRALNMLAEKARRAAGGAA